MIYTSEFTFEQLLGSRSLIICDLGLPFIIKNLNPKILYLTNLWLKIYTNWCVFPNMGIWFLTHNSENLDQNLFTAPKAYVCLGDLA